MTPQNKPLKKTPAKRAAVKKKAMKKAAPKKVAAKKASAKARTGKSKSSKTLPEAAKSLPIKSKLSRTGRAKIEYESQADFADSPAREDFLTANDDASEDASDASDVAFSGGDDWEASGTPVLALASEHGRRPEPESDAATRAYEKEYAKVPRNEQRLQKILAAAGVASRRKSEELILQGRVQVNKVTVTTLGTKADPQQDHIRVDGKRIHAAESHRYYVLNKPKGYVTTTHDPQGRPTVMDFFKKIGLRLYPVGRLDYYSEGLLIVTNDGALAQSLTHASSKVAKTYLVKVSGAPEEAAIEKLRQGVSIPLGRIGYEEGRVKTAPARIRAFREGENPWFEVTITEGRNRQLRKMFDQIGHHVEKIRRVGYGPLELDVAPGEMRELNVNEVRALQLAASGKAQPALRMMHRKLEAYPKSRAGKPHRRRAATS